jgi:hypothetical protein
MGTISFQFMLESVWLNEDLVLDPRKKFEHFTKNWSSDLQTEVKEMVQKKVRLQPTILIAT